MIGKNIGKQILEYRCRWPIEFRSWTNIGEKFFENIGIGRSLIHT